MNRKLLHLEDSIIRSFSSRDEVSDIFMFGSIVSGKSDKYSDIDIQVVSSNFDKTIRGIKQILREIDEPILVFPIENIKGNVALTVFWKNYSLYNKLDVGILDDISRSNIQTSVLHSIYESPKGVRKKPSKTYDDFDEDYRKFYDFYIGISRYCKYVNRNQMLSAYKFYKSSVESYIKLVLLEKNNNNVDNLGLIEYQTLEENLNRVEKKYIINLLTPGTQKRMNSNLASLSENYLKISKRLDFPIDLKFFKKTVELFDVYLD